MVDLRVDYNEVRNFLNEGIERFVNLKGESKAIGIYSNPNNGWVSLNFNLTKTIEDCYENCPDFEFVEFDLFESISWESEYENEFPQVIDFNGKKVAFDDFFGDEQFKVPFHNLLIEIAKDLRIKYEKTSFLVQMLDSNLAEVLPNSRFSL